MLRLLPLVWANLRRRPLRTLFTFLSVVVAFMLFGLLEAMRNGFFGGAELAGADRTMTMHKMSIIQQLPRSYADRIQSVPGVKVINYQSWFGGWYQNERTQLSTFAADHETFFDVYPEYRIPEEQKRAWLADRTAIIAGKDVAARFGWKVGDRIPLQQSIPYKQDGNTWEVTLAGIFDERSNNGNIIMRHDYLSEGSSWAQQRIGWVVSRLENPEDLPRVAKAIDSLFANSSTETKTSSEKTWVGDFAKQVGNIGAILSAVAFAVFFTMLLVTANTMAQSVRERTSELGVMKTLGFSNGAVTRMVLTEALLLTVAGGLLGLALAFLVSGGMRAALSAWLPFIRINASAATIAVLLMVLLGLAAGALPALRAMRLKVVDALRGA
jgi:putative ABC transport system permease protein